MANVFVVDVSTALKWFLDDEDDREQSLAVLQNISERNRPIVPILWFYEIGNAINVAIRRQRVTFERAREYLQILEGMPIDVDRPGKTAILQLIYLAREHNLTNYDAAYLELALRLALPLATNDKALRRAASACNVKRLFEEK